MKKVVLNYGLISGAIIAVFLFISCPLRDADVLDMDNGMWYGYGTMVIALSFIFLGIKNFRDKHAGGVITFGKAFAIGILIATIASLMYAIAWEICLKTVARDFLDTWTQEYLASLKSRVPEAEYLEKQQEMAGLSELYKNPFARFGMTILEIFPVGLLITLFSAAVLRKKNTNAA